MIGTKSRLLLAAAMMGAMGLGGCATKDYVNKQVGMVDTKVQAHDTRLAAQDAKLANHDSQLAGLDKTSREALERAEAAGKLAEGKFLYTMVLQDDGVKFRVNQAALSDDDQAKLNAFAEKLKADNHNVYIEIQGHTDASGGKDLNYRLGEARAEAVRLFLNKQGVALNRMSTISYGSDDPVQSNKTRAGRAANRRVVLVVLS
ncbi:OmpA family protein [Phenylobacterium montanum]|uniref:OmpA family protein n=1 Tax=Phenylobacterium montanum TaxID=2823693 RepID=A0A975G2S3_9CAUL|nr:OmpA family protein [Caulobacter sp. S6]QUD90073.1 OmpA family protein [Caulobacter sp. S6]